jgi:hypothetical protein
LTNLRIDEFEERHLREVRGCDCAPSLRQSVNLQLRKILNP